MRTVEELLQAAIAYSRPLEEIEFSLRDAHGCVTAQPVSADNRTVLSEGILLGDRELLTVASAGVARLSVLPRPRVVSLTVADDLVVVGAPAAAGQLPDAVNVMLTTAMRESGADGFRAGPVRLDAGFFANALNDQLVRCDLVLIVADLSFDHDTEELTSDAGRLIVEVLQQTGVAPIVFTAIDPGPVVGLTQLEHSGTPVLLIDGSPDSAFVGFEVFARPMMRVMAGRPNIFRPVVRARLTEAVKAAAGVRSFQFANIALDQASHAPMVTVLDGSRESAADWMYQANALVIIPEGIASLNAGDEAAVIRLDRE